MDDPYDGLGRNSLSRFRIVGFLILAVLILAFYAYTTPDSVAHAYFTGQCFKTPLPNACRFASHRVIVPPDLLNGTAPR
ncbi:MAG TPA: hypothetical protein VHX99_00485 [Rhizomicrobium sp.]|jgi:hypothetical protein|nr:hypothetical protein [Rhizomicrobium sp.]